LLRSGLLPDCQLPSANRQRPHFVADRYRRNSSPWGPRAARPALFPFYFSCRRPRGRSCRPAALFPHRV